MSYYLFNKGTEIATPARMKEYEKLEGFLKNAK
jgi:hypothetical protein